MASALLLHDYQKGPKDVSSPGYKYPEVGPEDIDKKNERFRDEIRCIKKDQLLEEILLKLKILEDGLMPHPVEGFRNRSIFKKVEGVYMEHSDAMAKRQLDESHKPLFMRLTREGYRVNGELMPQLKENIQDVQIIEDEMKSSWRNYIYDILHDEELSWIAMTIYVVIVLSILLSVTCQMFASVPEYHDHYVHEFETIEMIVTIIFTVEYGTRVVIVRNRCAYMVRLMNIFDILAILPWYTHLIGSTGETSIGGVMRALRLSRIAKIRQLATPYTNILLESLSNTVTGTGSSVALLLFICSVVTGSIVFECEKNAGSGFDNIPKSMWWSLVTLSTVGYGDISPSTTSGYFMGTATILVGILLSSLIIMVVGQYYIDLLSEYQNENRDIQKLLYAKCGPSHYRSIILNTTPKELYSRIKPELTCIFEELEDDSTEMVSEFEEEESSLARKLME